MQIWQLFIILRQPVTKSATVFILTSREPLSDLQASYRTVTRPVQEPLSCKMARETTIHFPYFQVKMNGNAIKWLRH